MVLFSCQHASGNDLCSLNTQRMLLLTRHFGADVSVALQASLRRNPAPDPRRDPSSVGSQLGALKFETGQKALFLGRAYYGCVATVLPPVTAGLTRKVLTTSGCWCHLLLLSACAQCHDCMAEVEIPACAHCHDYMAEVKMEIDQQQHMQIVVSSQL